MWTKTSVMKKNAVVVGAGINGLVASNYLQKNNFDVTLIEKNNYIGGACIKDTICLLYTSPSPRDGW